METNEHIMAVDAIPCLAVCNSGDNDDDDDEGRANNTGLENNVVFVDDTVCARKVEQGAMDKPAESGNNDDSGDSKIIVPVAVAVPLVGSEFAFDASALPPVSADNEMVMETICVFNRDTLMLVNIMTSAGK